MRSLAVVAAVCVLAATASADIESKIRSMQMPFVENQGQFQSEVAFTAATQRGSLVVTKGGELIHCLDGVAIRESLVRGRTVTVTGEERTPTNVSCFLGTDPDRWRSHLASYGTVSLGDVYRDIEVRVKAYGNRVEKIFRVKPGGDPGAIRMKVEGADSLRITDDGRLELTVGSRAVHFSAPIAFQTIDGHKHTVKVTYQLREGGYRFEVGEYDPERELVIDPWIQSTYWGGAEDDRGYCIGVHPETGQIYVAMSTDTPALYTAGYQRDLGGAGIQGSDVYLIRFQNDLSLALQATYYGGARHDEPAGGRGGQGGGHNLAFHPGNGGVYIAGNTNGDLPGVAHGAQDGRQGNLDAFVAYFNKELTILNQATYCGGHGLDTANGIVVYASFPPGSYDVSIVGSTDSTDLPGIDPDSAYKTLRGPFWDAYVARFNEGLTIMRTTYLGGGEDDRGYAIAHDPVHLMLFVTGETQSDDFVNLAGGKNTARGGYRDAFIARVRRELTVVEQTTLYGGSNADQGLAIAVHPLSGDIYVAGQTSSDDLVVPATAAQSNYADGGDGFVYRIEHTLDASSQHSATFLGGSGYESILDMEIREGTGSLYVVGWTSSPDFPFMSGAAQGALAGQDDAFVTRLHWGLSDSGPHQSTYFGGTSKDLGVGLAIDQVTFDVYITGLSWSPTLPAIDGALQETHSNVPAGAAQANEREAFVARIDSSLRTSGQPPPPVSNQDEGGGGSCTSVPGTGAAGLATFLLGLFAVLSWKISRHH